MHRALGLSAGLILLLLVGCAMPGRVELRSRTGGSAALYRQFQAFDGASGRRLSFDALVGRCRAADVIMFGEQHGAVVCNQLQAQLVHALIDSGRRFALAMEFFETDTQAALDAYLRGRLDESAFREQARQKGAYLISHRPLIELCRAARVPVIAANAPRRLVSAYRKSGEDYAAYRASVTPEEQRWLPAECSELTGAYRDRFLEVMSSHGPASAPAMPAPMTAPTSQPAQPPTTQPSGMPVVEHPTTQPVEHPTTQPVERPMMPPIMPPGATAEHVPTASEPPPTPTTMPTTMPTTAPSSTDEDAPPDPAAMLAKAEAFFAAQLLWDEAMADSVAQFRETFPAYDVLLIVGTFHVEQEGGTYLKYRQRRPNDRVLTVVYRGVTDGEFELADDDRNAADIVVYGMAEGD